MPDTLDMPLCTACGMPLGVYEPLWRLSLGRGERTSLLRMSDDAARGERLWHMDCARDAGMAAA